MKKILFTLSLGLLILLMFTACKNEVTSIEWASSNPKSQWNILQFDISKNSIAGSDIIEIFLEEEHQQIDGFGGCFNELGWEALNLISEKEREEIFKALFDTVAGCKFNICRMPIGANDYAVDWYSYNENKGDFEMKKFSVERDKQRLIPYIKKAKTYNSNLMIWASPWCPPSWMKENNNYACKPDKVNDLAEEGRGEEMQTQFRMDEKYLQSYALYFLKFINSYKAEGINISSVHVQNEPNSCQPFPSCVWTPKDLAVFIGDYLGPQFAKDELDVDIWLGTIERPQIGRIDVVLNHNEAKKYISGVGFQWAGKGAIPKVHKKYPDLKLMQTETECGDGSNNWQAAEYTFDLIKHYFDNGCNTYLYWNMVLNETGKSQWGWKQNSMITVDSESKVVTYNPEFYLMKHFSYYIKPGAYKIKTTNENCLAFKNDDSIVVVYYNSGNVIEKTFAIGDFEFAIELAEKSFNSFRICNF